MNIKKYISTSKINLFIGLAIISLIIALIFDFFDTKFSLHDILVEFHGLVFDLFIFGILLTIYETLKTKSEKESEKENTRIGLILRYKEEINDYKFWKSEEAMYRTRGLIKRLVELNATELNLSHCFLATDKSLSSYKNMQKWNFSASDLRNGLFLMSNMKNSRFYMTNLMDATFNQVDLTNCIFSSANLYNTKFNNCTFENVDLENVTVKSKEWFEQLEYNKNTGIKSLKLKFIINSKPEIINGNQVFKIKLK